MKRERKFNKRILIGIIIVVIFVIGIGAFFLLSIPSKPWEIPAIASGKAREAYQFAIDQPELLEYIPCYCGCNYEGHRHARDCFWNDDGTADKHGLTCSICVDVALKTKEMFEQGKSVCEIRTAIDEFYSANKDIATPTPMPTC